MSNHLSIVRSKGGADITIPLADLRRLVLAHPQCQLKTNPDGSANLIAQSSEGVFQVYWSPNHLWAERLDERFINPLIEIATLLGARVRGDESESYRSRDDTYIHPDDAAAVAANKTESAGRDRRRMYWNVARIAILAILAALMIKELFSSR